MERKEAKPFRSSASPPTGEKPARIEPVRSRKWHNLYRIAQASLSASSIRYLKGSHQQQKAGTALRGENIIKSFLIFRTCNFCAVVIRFGCHDIVEVLKACPISY
jgi:hypothetical protein